MADIKKSQSMSTDPAEFCLRFPTVDFEINRTCHLCSKTTTERYAWEAVKHNPEALLRTCRCGHRYCRECALWIRDLAWQCWGCDAQVMHEHVEDLRRPGAYSCYTCRYPMDSAWTWAWYTVGPGTLENRRVDWYLDDEAGGSGGQLEEGA